MLGKVGAVSSQCHQGVGTAWLRGHWGLSGLKPELHAAWARKRVFWDTSCHAVSLPDIGVRHFKGTER